MKDEMKYSVGELLSFAFTLVVIGIGVAYGLDVMSDVEDDFTAGSDEQMAVANATLGVAQVTEKLPTIATVVVASVIIGILLTYLYARFAKM